MTPEERIERRKYLGASEVAAVLGMDPFKGPHDVWAEKMGILGEAQEESEAAELGKLLEAPILKRYAVRNGAQLWTPGSMVSRTLPWARATPDALDGNDCIDIYALSHPHNIQVKLVGARMLHHWESGVPDYVKLQVQWEMMVVGEHFPGCTESKVVALLGGTEYREFDVPRDDGVIDALREVCGEWWTRHIVGGEMPTTDGSEACKAALSAKFKQSVGIEEPDSVVAALIRQYDDARQKESQWKTSKEAAGNALRALIGDREGFKGSGCSALWKFDATGKPRWKDIALAAGASEELIKQHTGAPERVLRVSVTT